MSEAAHHWKNVWIIGASSGIGRELAIQLAPVSEQVFISARSEEKLAAVAAQASNTTPVPLDINDHDAVKNICDEFVNSMGGLDLVVISSGIWKPAKLPDLNLDDFKLGMETNYLSVVHILSCLLPSL
ncbi:MAG: SDR family NAD(P)-dependent oxidoreductase, partial [Pseudomonadota bacterium]